MKKNFFNSFILIFSSLLIFSACSFEITDTKRINAPDTWNSESGISISLKNSMQDTLYVNIYRQDVTGCLNENSATTPIENIGIVFATDNNATFLYEDIYIFKGHTYRYYARIFDKVDGYTKTNWTEGVLAEKGISDDSLKFSYQKPSIAKFTFDEVEKKLIVSGNILEPSGISNFSTDFSPALIFQSGDKIQALQVESIQNEAIIYLTSILPLDFFDVNIKLLGIVGQKVETYTPKGSTQKINKRVIWTPLTEIGIFGKDGFAIQNNTIKLQTQYGDSGFDYSNN